MTHHNHNQLHQLPTRRRWFQFDTRVLLLAVAVIPPVLAWWHGRVIDEPTLHEKALGAWKSQPLVQGGLPVLIRSSNKSNFILDLERSTVPSSGNSRLYDCKVTYDEVVVMDWPVPQKVNAKRQEVFQLEVDSDGNANIIR